MEKTSKLQLWLGLGLVTLVVVGIVVARMLTSEPQDTRSQASVPGGVATVAITPNSRQLAPGERTTMTVSFNTNGTPVSGIAVRLIYTYTGASPGLTTEEIQPLIIKQNSWQCPVQNITPAGGTVSIDVGCITTNTSGFSSTSLTELFSFSLKAGSTPTTNPYTIMFDPQATQITKKSDGQDVAATPNGMATVSISGSASASPTPTPTTAAAATPTPTPSGSSFGTSTTTGKSCNQTCFSNRDCNSNLACLNGKCLSPSCPSDSSCSCDDVDVTTSTGDTDLPTAGGFDLTMLMLLVGGLFVVGGSSLFGSYWLKINHQP